jgi:hypothetical protein
LLGKLPDCLKNIKIIYRKTKNNNKLSAVLIDIVSPYHDDMELSEYRILLNSGQFAWNMCVLNKNLDEEMSDFESAEAKLLIRKLMKRKRELFPDDTRLIAACDVNLTPSGDYHIVAATAESEIA